MPKRKAPNKSAGHSTPAGCTVDLPHVPPLYGMKSPHKFLPFNHAEERLAKSRNYWICTAPSRWSSALDSGMGILARRQLLFRNRALHPQGPQPRA